MSKRETNTQSNIPYLRFMTSIKQLCKESKVLLKQSTFAYPSVNFSGLVC